MDSVSLIRQHPEATNDYDDEADVLYLSFGPPRPAVGIDAGGGTVVRVDETDGHVVGVALIGLRRLVEHELAETATASGVIR